MNYDLHLSLIAQIRTMYKIKGKKGNIHEKNKCYRGHITFHFKQRIRILKSEI